MSLFIAEPPPGYRLNPPAVLDSSVLSAFVYQEPNAHIALASMQTYALVAPAILPLEVANVAMNKLRRKLASAEDLGKQLGDFDFSCVSLQPVDALEAFTLAAHYKLSSYDASYLWLAGRLMAPLLSFDQKLLKAAEDYLASLPGKPEA